MLSFCQLISTLRYFRRDERAAAVVEMALFLPLFIMIFYGVIEFSRMMIIQQKLEKMVSTAGDFMTRSEFACSDDFPQFRTIVQNIMSPFAFEGDIIFTSLVNNNNDVPPCVAGAACISWQDGTGSRIGSAGSHPTNLPGSLIVDQGHNYIVTELVYNYQPLLALSGNFISGIAPRQVYLFNIHKPRQGSLSQLDPPNCLGNP